MGEEGFEPSRNGPKPPMLPSYIKRPDDSLLRSMTERVSLPVMFIAVGRGRFELPMSRSSAARLKPLSDRPDLDICLYKESHTNRTHLFWCLPISEGASCKCHTSYVCDHTHRRVSL